MKIITLEHLRVVNAAARRTDWRDIALGLAVVLGLVLATPWLRALASYTWGGGM